MCDTLGRIGASGAFFAKNSDRSPNEVQLLEFHPAREGLSGEVACTYISVPQAERTHGVLLSRPEWMWGAEMGVNQWGLCIGNEAVFTKGRYGPNALTGMDMVRLALERCTTAAQALKLLISLLETYGQGGNCGFDHDFRYDNAFLIMDARELYVLETAGKHWVWKKSGSANISNRLSIGTDGDAYSTGSPYDFRGRHTEPVFTYFSGSRNRAAILGGCAGDSVRSCIDGLSRHGSGAKPFSAGSVQSPCMHFGGLVGDHSTASLVAVPEEGKTMLWLTGCSLPCVSLFKPWRFGTEPVLPVTAPGDETGKAYWMEAERFRRKLTGKVLPAEFYAQRDAIQNSWLARAEHIAEADFAAFSTACLEEERAFYTRWSEADLADSATAPGFRSRWAAKNRVLFPDGL